MSHRRPPRALAAVVLEHPTIAGLALVVLVLPGGVLCRWRWRGTCGAFVAAGWG